MRNEENIIRYFNSHIKLEKARLRNLKAKKFRMLVENESNCNLLTYPFYFIKWKTKYKKQDANDSQSALEVKE